MIHIALNPDDPIDDWKTICSTFELVPALQHNEVVQTSEIAKAKRDEGLMVCEACLTTFQIEVEEVEDGS